MAIPEVNLNVDPKGYAGSLVRPMQFPGGGSGGPELSGIYDLLREQAEIRNRIAKQQLEMMKQGLKDAAQGRRHRERAHLSSLRTPAKSSEQKLKEGMLRQQERSMMLANRPEDYSEWARTAIENAPGRAHALEGGQSGIRRLMMAAKTFGPQALHRGMMQTGGLLASQSADPRAALFDAQANLINQQTQQSPYGYGGIAPGARASDPGSGGFMGPIPTGGAKVAPGSTFTNRNTGTPRGYKKGSLPGTVPKTDTYKLHKGEVVLEADQVDEPLMYYLVNDKLRKGLMPKRSKGKSYQHSSLIDPALYAAVAPPGALDDIPLSPEGLDEDTLPMDRKSFMSAEDIPPGGLGGMIGKTPEWLGRAAGAGAGAVFSGIGDALGGLASGFSRGFSGPPQSLEDAVAAAQEGSAEPLPMEPRGMKPLERPLREAGLSPKPPMRSEDSYFAPENPEWRERQHEKIMAISNRMKADRLANYLRADPKELKQDPNLQKTLMDEVKRLTSLADMEDQRQERRKALTEAYKTDIQKAFIRAQSEAFKAQVKGEDADRTAAREAYEDLQEKVYELKKELSSEPDDGQRMRLAKTLSRYGWQIEGADSPEEYYAQLAEDYDL